MTNTGLRANVLAAFVLLAASASVQAAEYPSGTLKLIPDSKFGAKTSWDMMFKSEFDRKLAFLPDGSFFKSAYKDGKIYRLDSNGTKVAEFGGRVGQGPGDLGGAKLIDVLDGTTIIVYEEVNRRLSLFDLDGQFIKTAKIESPGISAIEPVMGLAALGNGKIAVVSKEQSSTFWIKRYRVLIKDLTTAVETEIAAFVDEKPQSPIFIRIDQFDGAVYLAKAGNDRLLVAYSKSPEIAIYSFDGKKLSTFAIESQKIPVAFDHLESVMVPDPKDAKAVEGYQKVIVANRDKIRLPEFHPYYLGLTVDSEGRIVLVSNNLAKKTKEISWMVYSPEGKSLGTVKIEQKPYSLVHPYEPVIRGEFFYALLARDDPDGTQFLAKVKIAD